MRIAVYAGTFDPITLGHLSVIRRVLALFDELIILVAVHPEKQPLFSMNERLDMIRDAVRLYSNVRVEATTDWVAAWAENHGASWLIRGVRDATDMSMEHPMAFMNQQLAPGVTTLFVPAESEFTNVSSSKLKQLAKEGATLEEWCTPKVEQLLKRRLAASAFMEQKGIT
jgi:pantetheine-phosphate adenylyltransferase